MDHGTIFLRGFIRMRKQSESLKNEMLRIAVQSHNYAEGLSYTTLSQAEKIAEYSLERERCAEFADATLSALELTDRGNRALLISVYFKRADKTAICKKYGVSRRTLYRKIAAAKKKFSACLNFLGYGPDWLYEHFPDEDWIAEALCKKESDFERCGARAVKIG